MSKNHRKWADAEGRLLLALYCMKIRKCTNSYNARNSLLPSERETILASQNWVFAIPLIYEMYTYYKDNPELLNFFLNHLF